MGLNIIISFLYYYKPRYHKKRLRNFYNSIISKFRKLLELDHLLGFL